MKVLSIYQNFKIVTNSLIKRTLYCYKMVKRINQGHKIYNLLLKQFRGYNKIKYYYQKN